MNSESELHKSQITNSASPNTDAFESKKKTTSNIILVNQKPNGGGISKGSNINTSGSNFRVNYNQRDEEFTYYKIRKESLISQYYQQQQKENINSTNQVVMGPLEKSILKDHQYGFPNSQQNTQPSNSTSNFLLNSTLNLAPLINGQQPSINNLGKLPDYNKNTNYYQEFWKMYYTNEVIISKLNDYKKEIQQIRDKANKLEEMIIHLDEGASDEEDSKSKTNTVQKMKKKNRRCAQEIQKDFNCPYENCNKTYGSEVSLNLHIKIKHNGGNKTERERLARQIFAAKINGEDIPEMNLNLPPGFMEDLNSGGPKSDLKPNPIPDEKIDTKESKNANK